jgi:hypothetical protein
MAAYREVGILAEGGMAIVAQGVRDDGGTVVVKRVRPPFCFDAAYLRLFHDEGAVHAALDHPNIVRLLDRGEDEAGPFLVFEHVDGTDLGVVLEAAFRDGRGLDVECVLAVAIPLFQALACAHAATDPSTGTPLGVVHRDVSPGNILLGNDGSVKLADFGVAASALKTEVTVAGEMKGKFAYMAPEQTRGERVTAKADLFAAGIVLWECLAGKKLFDGPTDADVVAAVRGLDPPPLPEAVPQALRTLVAGLLQKEPDQRPADAKSVVAALAAAAQELGFDEGLHRHAARMARTAPRREAQPREVDARRRTHRLVGVDPGAMTVERARRSPLPWIAALAAAVVAGAGIALAGRAPAQEREEVVPLPPAPPPVVAAPPPAPPPPVPAAPPPAPAEPGRGRRPDQKQEPKPDVKPAKVEAAEPKGFASLSLTSEPWASVSIDGVLVKKETPLIHFDLPAGRHVIVLENPHYGVRERFEVELAPGQHLKRFVELNR